MTIKSFEDAISHAKEFDAQKDWNNLESFSKEIAAQFPQKAEGWLLHALAKHRLNDDLIAAGSVERGLAISPTSNWGLNLAIAIYRRSKRHTECLDLVNRLVNLPSANAEHFATAAEYYAEIGEWSKAAKYSIGRRDKLIAYQQHKVEVHSEKDELTIVIQAFARADRIKELLDSLELAHGRDSCNLVICIDSAVNSRNPQKYSAPNEDVIASIAARTPSLLESYRNVTISKNPVNLGTALTAQRACDLGFKLSDNIIFFEEDCIVAPGTINWFRFGLRKLRNEGTFWFVAGESPFFDSKGKAVPPEILAIAQRVANIESVRTTYIEENYVPSTCFATTFDIWKQVRSVRGLPRGAEHISTYLTENRMKTILPSVPFVKDVGMQDELGYSVAKLGKEGVKEAKTVYVMNEETGESFTPAKFNKSHLYCATSKLEIGLFDKLELQ